MSAAGASRSVFDYLDRKPIQKPSGLLQSHEFRGDIEFQNVSLVYPARPDEIAVQVCSSFLLERTKKWIFFFFFAQNVSFKIKAGEICAFVGPSGSGNRIFSFLSGLFRSAIRLIR